MVQGTSGCENGWAQKSLMVDSEHCTWRTQFDGVDEGVGAVRVGAVVGLRGNMNLTSGTPPVDDRASHASAALRWEGFFPSPERMIN
jgi:hypothetical protein